eukprot:1977553-Amphidinium_carterae.1
MNQERSILISTFQQFDELRSRFSPLCADSLYGSLDSSVKGRCSMVAMAQSQGHLGVFCCAQTSN